MAVHAEDDDIVNYMRAKLKREGRDQGYNLHLVHNNISEDLAFRKISAWRRILRQPSTSSTPRPRRESRP